MTYRYAIDSVRTQIELIQGSKLNSDTYVSIIPNVKTINSVESNWCRVITAVITCNYSLRFPVTCNL